jgi:indole-3-glycerol phosphate synthase
MLNSIIVHKRKEIEETFTEEYLAKVMSSPRVRSAGFLNALKNAEGCAVIAEIKKASPSRGIIKEDFDVATIAKSYDSRYVDCVSVLTEKRYFMGDNSYISIAREISKRPVLRKDFIIDKRQLYESNFLGADAVLLIAAILEKKQLANLFDLAKELFMDVLVEIHDEIDLEKALFAGADLIGINNRDLTTFKTDISNTVKLAPKIPKGRFVISESGISCSEDIRRLLEVGVRGFLIGESLMRAENIEDKLKELVYGYKDKDMRDQKQQGSGDYQHIPS